MECIALNFFIAYLINTNSYETVVRQDCIINNKSEIVFTLAELNQSKVEVIHYNQKDNIYYAKEIR